MKVTGLTHQWGDQLLAQFASEPGSHEIYAERAVAIRDLLTYLETIEGPDLWVGTSHSLLNFCARDTRDEDDRVPSLAFLQAVALGGYEIKYPLPREFRPWFDRMPEVKNPWYETLPGKENPWDDAMVSGFANDVETAASMLLIAIESSDANPKRHRSDWMWYVCPTCDFHLPHYNTNCERCGFVFPSEKKTESIGLYRKVALPEGVVTPRQSS